MELTTYISFCIASFLMALMPGPDNIYVLTESLAKGARNGLWIAFGLNSGVVVHTLLAASGLSLILKESELAFQLLSYLGAAYLFYLAFQATKEKIEVDGGMGPATLKAIQNLELERVRAYRVLRFANLVIKKPEQERFWFGWYRRSMEV